MTDKITFGHKCSNYFAGKFASWLFVVPFIFAVNGWAFLNGFGYVKIDKDLAFVNFFISFVTLFIDIVIIMNQRRQTEMDREKLATILRLEKKIDEKLDKIIDLVKSK